MLVLDVNIVRIYVHPLMLDCCHLKFWYITGCTHGNIRLVGGSNSQEGRVEICLNGQWGTVCHDYWSQVDANIACRQLGYSNSGSLKFIIKNHKIILQKLFQILLQFLRPTLVKGLFQFCWMMCLAWDQSHNSLTAPMIVTLGIVHIRKMLE